MRSVRGFFVSEMIVAVFIIVLLFTAIGALVGPIVNAHQQESAKSDTITAAAYGLDTMERDIRQSDGGGVFACTVSLVVTCSQPGSLTTTSYLAVVTADNSSGTFQVKGTGDPNWSGWYVYSQPSGGSIIYRTYETLGSGVNPSAAATAVADAATLPAGTAIVIPAAQSMSIDVNGVQADFQLIAAGKNGDASNSTRYTTTILLRN